MWLFSTALVVAAVVLYEVFLSRVPALPRPFEIPVWVLGILFAAAEVCVVHVHIKRQAFSASLSEVPLVLGLYFVSPGQLILAYVVGAGAALVVHRRQPLMKLFFNLSHLALQACLTGVFFYTLLGSNDPVKPRGWVAAVAAMMITDVLAGLVISAVMSLAEGRITLVPQMIGMGTAASFANTALGLTAATILWARIDAAWLLIFPATLLLLAYRGYVHQREKHRSLEQLYDSTQILQRSLGQESVVEVLLEQARSLLRAEMAELIVFTSGAGDEGQRSLLGPGRTVATSKVKLDVREGVWARVASEGRGLLVARPMKEEKLRSYFAPQGIKDVIVAPLVGEDEIRGTLMVANRLGDVGTFDDQDLKMLETLAGHASMSLEKGRLLESLQEQARVNEYLAKHDPLTDLSNRAEFLAQIRGAIDNAKRTDAAVVTLLMDIDRFKEVNDTLGHQVGDTMLIDIAHRLRSILPEGAQLSRVGGDEFAILLADVDDTSSANEVAESIIDGMRAPFRLDNATLEVQGSIGIAVYPLHARDADGLLQRADVAMYLAKEARSGYEVYGSDRDHYSPGRLTLVGELRKAIDEGDLVVFYQPKISVTTGEVEGLEALVRWEHPEKGLVPPIEFIPLAEHTGLIKPLTSYVIRQAVQDLLIWRRTYPNLHVAVNLSVKSLTDANICQEITEILDELDAPRGSLELEITESSIMDDPTRSIGVLTQLAEMGISLSIDDFGTGYSSLSYLKRLPVDSLKIDRSFVLGMEADENDAIIVRSIIDLGSNLGLKVVAEGVEGDEVLEVLRGMGCDVAQGFGISRPLPAAKIEPWLIAHESLRSQSTKGDSTVTPFRSASGN